MSRAPFIAKSIAAIFVAGAVTASAAPRASAETNILTNCLWAPQHFMCHDVMPEWAKWVEEATEGRVVISFPANRIGGPPEQLDSVQNGVVDAAVQFNGFLMNRVVGPVVGMLPFTAIDSTEAMAAAIWRTHEKFFAEKNELESVKILSIFMGAGGVMFSLTDDPIVTLEDLQNRKIWGVAGMVANVLKAVDSPVVAGPAVQVQEIISRGVVDGYVGLPVGAAQQFKVLSYAKSITLLERRNVAPSFLLVVSQSKWAEISPEDQAAIEEVSGEVFGRLAGRLWDEDEKKGIEIAKQENIPFVKGDDGLLPAMIEATNPIITDWVSRANELGVDGEAALKFYQETAAEVAAEVAAAN